MGKRNLTIWPKIVVLSICPEPSLMFLLVNYISLLAGVAASVKSNQNFTSTTQLSRLDPGTFGRLAAQGCKRTWHSSKQCVCGKNDRRMRMATIVSIVAMVSSF